MGELNQTLRRHSVIGIDTPIFIYHIGAEPRFASLATSFLTDLQRGMFRRMTSALTLMEIAVKPLRLGRPDIADQYEALVLAISHLSVMDLERPIMRRAAELRAHYRIRPADPLQMASCLQSGATAFLTNDKRLRRVAELDVLILEDFLNA